MTKHRRGKDMNKSIITDKQIAKRVIKYTEEIRKMYDKDSIKSFQDLKKSLFKNELNNISEVDEDGNKGK